MLSGSHNAAQSDTTLPFAMSLPVTRATDAQDPRHDQRRSIVQGDEVEEFWALKNVSFEVRAVTGSALLAEMGPANLPAEFSAASPNRLTAGSGSLDE